VARDDRLGRTRTLLLIVVLIAVAACGEGGPTGAASPAASTSTADPLDAASPAASPPTPPAFWTLASRALNATGRLRVIVVGGSPDELRIETRASAALLEGILTVVCVEGQAYAVDGFRATPWPARWTCGTNAFVSSLRRTGRPLEAWNASIPVDTSIRERVLPEGRDRWRWEYVGRSPILDGPVRATLIMDAATGRLLSGTRSDPSGNVRWTFSYTTIFTPVQLP